MNPTNTSYFGYARSMSFDPLMSLQSEALKEAGCRTISRESCATGRRELPELERCLSLLRPGDVLVVWRLDCLGRTLRELVSIVASLAERNVGLVSLNDELKTQDAEGDGVLRTFMAMAQFERNCIQERGTLRREAARKRGRTGARNRKLTDTQLTEILSELQDPRVVISELARRYGVSRSTVYAYARSHGIGITEAA
ncbi:MAG: recombinase family protein [Zoogloea sp.]|uniref:recombinase family protein n=1 Tax=Zoogloea sp. TaxID=49181 RepID=UPI003F32374C